MRARVSIAGAGLCELPTLGSALRAAGHALLPGEAGADTTPEGEILLLEVKPGDAVGLDRISTVRALPTPPLIVGIVDEADVHTAVKAMRAGASEILERPLSNDQVLACLEGLISSSQVARESNCAGNLNPSLLLGRTPVMQTLREWIGRAARASNSTVLVLGESGVGKELVAREIHARSTRATKPFVAVNCASLSDTLLESELFGYATGAFTGGHPKGQAGLVAAAEGGTLFLDEVGELSALAQAKLLRFLQERSIRRLGEAQERACDVRILAATNRDLAKLVDAGAFREDLYYRLNVLSLVVPPLRDRLDDLGELALAKLQMQCDGTGLAQPEVRPDALEYLRQHRWPGNVRELESVLARALLHARNGVIDAQALQSAGFSTAISAHPGDAHWPDLPSLREAEESLIRRALKNSRGNKSKAARELGIHRATLYQKPRSLGLH